MLFKAQLVLIIVVVFITAYHMLITFWNGFQEAGNGACTKTTEEENACFIGVLVHVPSCRECNRLLHNLTLGGNVQWLPKVREFDKPTSFLAPVPPPL